MKILYSLVASLAGFTGIIVALYALYQLLVQGLVTSADYILVIFALFIIGTIFNHLAENK